MTHAEWIHHKELAGHCKRKPKIYRYWLHAFFCWAEQKTCNELQWYVCVCCRCIFTTYLHLTLNPAKDSPTKTRTNRFMLARWGVPLSIRWSRHVLWQKGLEQVIGMSVSLWDDILYLVIPWQKWWMYPFKNDSETLHKQILWDTCSMFRGNFGSFFGFWMRNRKMVS